MAKSTNKACIKCGRPVPVRRKRNRYVCSNTPAGKGSPCRQRQELRLSALKKQLAKKKR